MIEDRAGGGHILAPAACGHVLVRIKPGKRADVACSLAPSAPRVTRGCAGGCLPSGPLDPTSEHEFIAGPQRPCACKHCAARREKVELLRIVAPDHEAEQGITPNWVLDRPIAVVTLAIGRG